MSTPEEAADNAEINYNNTIELFKQRIPAEIAARAAALADPTNAVKRAELDAAMAALNAGALMMDQAGDVVDETKRATASRPAAAFCSEPRRAAVCRN